MLKYRKDTGAIVGIWESNTLALVQAQMVTEDAVYGYLLPEEDVEVSRVQETHVVREGRLVQRSKEG